MIWDPVPNMKKRNQMENGKWKKIYFEQKSRKISNETEILVNKNANKQ